MNTHHNHQGIGRAHWGLIALMLLVAGLTVALQSYNVSFWGMRHGWTSSHSLAIIERSTPQNGFVGYAQAFRMEDGSITYDYFDRYPPFFSAAMNAALSPFDDLPTQIYVARQIMNGILLLAMFTGYRLVRLFVPNRYLALAVTVLSFSSYYVLYYKDMPDFHPPVVLGFLLTSYSIARYKLHDKRTQVYIVPLLCVMLAFGYSVLFALALWALIDGVHRLAQRRFDLWNVDAVRVLALGVLLSAGTIAYNVNMEARTRGVPVTETSVVDSILRRIPFLADAVVETSAPSAASAAGLVGWAEFFLVQLERIVWWSLPLKVGDATGIGFTPGSSPLDVSWAFIALGVGMLALVGVFAARQDAHRRDIVLITAFGPLLFLFAMMNLTAIHDFVTMFAAGFTLMLWTAALRPAIRSRLLVGVLVVGNIGLYAGSSAWVRAVQQAEITEGASFTYDFERMQPHINGENNTILLDYRRHNPECIIRNWQCFALGYYLGDNYLTEYPEFADYVLSPRPYYATQTFAAPGTDLSLITAPTNPENERVYLLDMADTQPRTAPTTDANAHQFGEYLQLYDWRLLNDDVRVQPCARIFVESWWRVEQLPDVNYSLQAVLVDGDGNPVADANTPLGAVPTSIWEAGQFTADVRSIAVPCDTLPGEYPLILGVYNPDTLEPLPVTDTDGNGVGNQLYLTTIIVD